MNLDHLTRQELVDQLTALIKKENERAQDKDRVLHDLHVHQVELELQNRNLREAQSALEASRARFEELYDFAPVAYFTLDAHGQVLEANLTGATMVGGDRAKIIGTPFLALVKMDDPAAFWRHLRRCNTEAKPVVTDLRLSVEGRGQRDVQVASAPVFDPAGRPIAFRSAFTDITARVAAEAQVDQLRKDEERLRRGFESLDGATIALSRTLALSHAPVESLFQVIVDQARSIADAQFAALGVGNDPDKPFESWTFSGVDPAHAAIMGRYPRPRGLLGEVVRTGRVVRLRDLREHPAFVGFPPEHPSMTSFLGVPVFSTGRIIGHLYLANKRSADEFSAEDQQFVEMLTERAGIVLQIKQLNEEVQAAVRTRDNLLAVVSHDLRSPLSAIQLSATLAMLPPPGGDRRANRKQLDVIARSAERMSHLIDDLLQAATIEAATFTISPEREDVGPLVDEVLAAIEPLAAEKSIHLQKRAPPNLPPIYCDRYRLGQVFGNLLGNAVKFVPEQGKIEVRAWVQEKDVHFAVCDNGPGVPDDQVAHLFDRYWKGKAEGRHGTGLGLFIAKGIVDAHGGRIWFENEANGGSSVHFTIPIAKDGEANER
jgi:PAS domain S-box-containing protein